MSLKVYAGIKFHSKSMPEVIAQLHSIREQARKNSEDYFINNPMISIGEDTSVDAVLNTKGDPEARKKFCWELMRTLREELGKTWRSNGGCDFKLEVCIIPWTDGNIYGTLYEDNIGANRDLVLTIADEYHYQNQTDKPDEISDEEWSEREEVWEAIFDKYWSPAEAGALYTIVGADDLHVSTVNKMLEKFDENFYDEKGYVLSVKSSLSGDELKKINFEEQIKSSSDFVNCDYIGWFEKADTTYLVYCKTQEDRDKVVDFFKLQEHITIKEEKNTYVAKRRFEE